MHIQNRWVVFALFLICSIGVLIGLYQYRHTKTVDLSAVEINDIKLNEKFNSKGYEVNKKIKFDRFKFYNSKAHPDFTVKVREKDNVVKGIILVKDEKVSTNFDGSIDSPINDAIDNLGFGYKKSNVGNGFQSVKYIDRDHHLKLNLLYRDQEIKRIEFFSK
ncbi:hypothetical protein J2P86_11660 [Staphylococcus sp. 30400_3112M30941]|nr:hypothetical protein [Staphylococcus sp. 30403_3112M30944]MBO0946670.1 hypothetical protein [Staphylococcus sp. 30402_3112M30943]MBO0965234.1 hypothetical protein [Staphylococcus sp. 30400_3112M30941]MBO0967767.1 hypothetical protein [Staphylococcus sp. 30401_3112M30942]